VKLPISKDGSVRLPNEVLEALMAEPGDTLKVFVDKKRKAVRLERFSEDPWADAMREGPSKGLEDILADQQKRQAEAEDLFDQKLKETDGEKPEDDFDKWR
jgi:bifunctional DNA-binding transcriptional regulator/antitoxin component of YhaV-PrlF toxin-antitoxin module